MLSIQCLVSTNFWKCADLSHFAQCSLLARAQPSSNGFNIIKPPLCTLCRPEFYFIKLVKFSVSDLSNLIPSRVFFFYFLGIAKLITRINECIICSGFEFSNGDVEYLFVNSLENSFTRARARYKFKDTSVMDFTERTVGSFVEDLENQQFEVNENIVKTLFWHIFQAVHINVQHKLQAGIQHRLYLQPIRMKLASLFLPQTLIWALQYPYQNFEVN